MSNTSKNTLEVTVKMDRAAAKQFSAMAENRECPHDPGIHDCEFCKGELVTDLLSKHEQSRDNPT